MRSDKNAILAGLFILLCVALTAGVVIAVRGAGGLLAERTEYAARFTLEDDVAGLRPGSEVRVGGVARGSVTAVELQLDDNPGVLVKFALPEQIRLRQGAEVGVQSTLTGNVWLNVYALGAGEPLAAGQAVAGRPGIFSELTQGINELLPQARDLVTTIRSDTVPRVNETVTATRDFVRNANTTVETARQFVERADAQIEPLATQLRTAAADGSALFGDARATLAENRDNLRTATGHLASAAKTADERLPEVANDVKALAEAGRASLGSADAALDEVRALAASGRGVVERNRTRIDEIVSNVRVASDEGKAAIREVRRSPWRLLARPEGEALANQDLYAAARDYADAAADLAAASTALRDALNDPTLEADMLKQLLEKLEQAGQGYDQVERTLFDRLEE